MIGIQYVTDEKGRPVAVQIDLKKHAQLWEDFQDLLEFEKRKKEPRKALNTIIKDLEKEGKL